jgi:co-chaperonin GroES (HSP10)
MPHMVMTHDTDPKDILTTELGDISGFEIFNNQVLCAVYVRPQKTKSGIYLTSQTVEEDKIQGKVGLVVKTGPDAFTDTTGEWFNDMDIELWDWVVFRPSDGWSITVNGVLCRILDDTNIRGRVQHPDQVW